MLVEQPEIQIVAILVAGAGDDVGRSGMQPEIDDVTLSVVEHAGIGLVRKLQTVVASRHGTSDQLLSHLAGPAILRTHRRWTQRQAEAGETGSGQGLGSKRQFVAHGGLPTR